MAIYIQSTNRREEACLHIIIHCWKRKSILATYFQINSAVRTAGAHGFLRSDGMKGYIQSEKGYLNRLWGTIYMREK